MNVTLHLSSGCNLRCTYCFEGDHEDREDMSLAVAHAAVELALRDGGDRPGIIFFGGEPLLRRDLIVSAIAHARALCDARSGSERSVLPHFKITTNGLLLDDEFLALCATEDVAISLSIDGVKPAHDRHRLTVAGKGSFARVEERARALLRYRPYSPAIMVTTPETVAHAAAGVRHLFELGFRYVIFQLNYAGAWDEAALEELRHQYEQMARLYLDMTRREEKFYLAPFDVKIATHIRGSEARGLLCKLGVRQVSVAPDGTLFPCVQFVGRGLERSIGDVYRGILTATRDALFEETERDHPDCVRCAIRARCNRRCGCLNLQTEGEVGAPSAVLCAHERMIVPIADAVAATLWRERSPMFVHKHYNPGFAILSLIEDRAA